MYVLIVSARIKPEQRGRFLEAIEENAVSSVRDERLPPLRRGPRQRRPRPLPLYEVYRDEEAFQAHRDTDHFARWREAADVCLSEPLEATHAAMVVTRGDRGRAVSRRGRWWPWPRPPGPGRRWGGRRR